MGVLRGCFGRHGRRPGFGHLGKDVFLVSGITLDRVHEVGNEIIPPFELDFDVRPGFFRTVAQGDETVVGLEEPDRQQDNDAEQNPKDRGHIHSK